MLLGRILLLLRTSAAPFCPPSLHTCGAPALEASVQGPYLHLLAILTLLPAVLSYCPQRIPGAQGSTSREASGLLLQVLLMGLGSMRWPVLGPE